MDANVKAVRSSLIRDIWYEHRQTELARGVFDLGWWDGAKNVWKSKFWWHKNDGKEIFELKK